MHGQTQIRFIKIGSVVYLWNGYVNNYYIIHGITSGREHIAEYMKSTVAVINILRVIFVLNI
jgi:hypothetical protein